MPAACKADAVGGGGGRVRARRPVASPPLSGGKDRKVSQLFARLHQDERERAQTYDPDAYPLPRYLSLDNASYGIALRSAWTTFYPDETDGARTPCAVLRSVAHLPAASAGGVVQVPFLQVTTDSASLPSSGDGAQATRVTLAYGDGACETLQEWLRAALRIMAFTCASSADEAASYLLSLEKIFQDNPEDGPSRVVPFSFEEWECVWSIVALDASLALGERKRFAWRSVAGGSVEDAPRDAELLIRLTPSEKAALDARVGGA